MDDLPLETTSYLEATRPRENRFQRLVRLHFWVTVLGAVAWSVASVVIVKRAPNWFPKRWDQYMSYPHHHIVFRAVTLIAVEVVATFTVYVKGGPMARFIAFFVGGYLLVGFGIVEPALASLQVPIQIWDVVVMLWIGTGHVAYGLLGSSELLR